MGGGCPDSEASSEVNIPNIIAEALLNCPQPPLGGCHPEAPRLPLSLDQSRQQPHSLSISLFVITDLVLGVFGEGSGAHLAPESLHLSLCAGGLLQDLP